MKPRSGGGTKPPKTVIGRLDKNTPMKPHITGKSAESTFAPMISLAPSWVPTVQSFLSSGGSAGDWTGLEGIEAEMFGAGRGIGGKGVLATVAGIGGLWGGGGVEGVAVAGARPAA